MKKTIGVNSDAISLDFSYDDFITFHGKQVIPYTEPKANEFFWHCPRALGCGTFQRIKIRPEFDLWLTDCSFYRDIIFRNYDMPVTIQFNFTLSGHSRMRIHPHDKKQVESVRDLLDDNMETPPSLQQLAKQRACPTPNSTGASKRCMG